MALIIVESTLTVVSLKTFKSRIISITREKALLCLDLEAILGESPEKMANHLEYMFQVVGY